MDVKDAIDARRAYRSLEHIKITEKHIKELAYSAQLAPSCFNNQPWRFVFVYSPEMLQALQSALSKTNAWVQAASLIVAVFSRPEDDCRIRSREYYLFDTGMATAFLLLRATDLGLVAHPIAGYDEPKAKQILDIPEEMRLITLVVVGKRSETISPILTETQAVSERKRPKRLPLEKFVHLNRFKMENEIS
ncbi:MAG: nitroreductase family protein [Candidatus Heimdallarchaeota archaeon]